MTARGRVEAAQRGGQRGHVVPMHGRAGLRQRLLLPEFDGAERLLRRRLRPRRTGWSAGSGRSWAISRRRCSATSPPTKPVPAGLPMVISDVHLAIRPDCVREEQASALLFMDMLAQIYTGLEKPATDFHDWPARADQTLRDLGPLARRIDPALWPHVPAPLCRRRVSRQHGPAVGVDRHPRVRQMVGPKKRAWKTNFPGASTNSMTPSLASCAAICQMLARTRTVLRWDSWYLYHPLTNLARLAADGDQTASKLFLGSLDYAISAARHFRYRWPIQYDVRDFKVLVEARNDQGLGQTDVGGLYAYVMLQAHALTGKTRYRREAEKALRAAEGLRFEMAYQANLSAWGRRSRAHAVATIGRQLVSGAGARLSRGPVPQLRSLGIADQDRAALPKFSGANLPA